MNEQDLRDAIKSNISEFEPVRIHLSNGSTLDVTHPESILIGPTTSALLVGRTIRLIANVHINQVEPLNPAKI